MLGPDQTFSERARGPSGVDWKSCFTLYKKAIISMPPDHLTYLLTWYDNQLFPTSASVSSLAPSSSSRDQGASEVEDLVKRLNRVDVTSVSLPPSTTPGISVTPAPELPASRSTPLISPADATPLFNPTPEDDNAQVTVPTQQRRTRSNNKPKSQPANGSRGAHAGNNK